MKPQYTKPALSSSINREFKSLWGNQKWPWFLEQGQIVQTNFNFTNGITNCLSSLKLDTQIFVLMLPTTLYVLQNWRELFCGTDWHIVTSILTDKWLFLTSFSLRNWCSRSPALISRISQKILKYSLENIREKSSRVEKFVAHKYGQEPKLFPTRVFLRHHLWILEHNKQNL